MLSPVLWLPAGPPSVRDRRPKGLTYRLPLGACLQNVLTILLLPVGPKAVLSSTGDMFAECTQGSTPSRPKGLVYRLPLGACLQNVRRGLLLLVGPKAVLSSTGGMFAECTQGSTPPSFICSGQNQQDPIS